MAQSTGKAIKSKAASKRAPPNHPTSPSSRSGAQKKKKTSSSNGKRPAKAKSSAKPAAVPVRRSRRTNKQSDDPSPAVIPELTPSPKATNPVTNAATKATNTPTNETTLAAYAKPSSEDTSDIHKALFERAILDVSKGKNSKLPTKETYQRMVEVLTRNKEGQKGGDSISKLRSEGFKSAQHWINNFSIMSFEKTNPDKDSYILIKKPAEGSPIDQALKICTKEKLFDVLNEEYRNKPVGGEGLWRRIGEKKGQQSKAVLLSVHEDVPRPPRISHCCQEAGGG